MYSSYWVYLKRVPILIIIIMLCGCSSCDKWAYRKALKLEYLGNELEALKILNKIKTPNKEIEKRKLLLQESLYSTAFGYAHEGKYSESREILDVISDGKIRLNILLRQDIAFLKLKISLASDPKLSSRVSQIFNNAFSSPLKPGKLVGPVVTIMNRVYEGRNWELEKLPFIEIPTSLSETKTLVCIKEDRLLCFNYYGGIPGYEPVWNIRFVSWPNGEVFHSLEVYGDIPPVFVSCGWGTTAIYGRRPVGKLVHWLLRELGDSSVINHGQEISDMIFSPDSKILASAGGKEIKLWNVNKGNLIQTYSFEEGYVSRLAFSPNGKILACSWRSYTEPASSIYLWNVETQKIILAAHKRKNTQASEINEIKFSPNGETLSIAYSNGKIGIWNFGTGSKIYTFSGYKYSTEKLAFSLDGKMLISAGYDNGKIVLRLWDVSTKKLIYSFVGDSCFSNVAFSPDGKMVAWVTSDDSSYYSDVKLWESETGRLLCTFVFSDDDIDVDEEYINPNINVLTFTPNCKFLALGGAKIVKLLRVEAIVGFTKASDTKLYSSEVEAYTLKEHGLISHIACSSDGKILASSSGELIKLWNAMSYIDAECW